MSICLETLFFASSSFIPRLAQIVFVIADVELFIICGFLFNSRNNDSRKPELNSKLLCSYSSEFLFVFVLLETFLFPSSPEPNNVS